jgi:hypothetical protein
LIDIGVFVEAGGKGKAQGNGIFSSCLFTYNFLTRKKMNNKKDAINQSRLVKCQIYFDKWVKIWNLIFKIKIFSQ